jgi:hypothetical protein
VSSSPVSTFGLVLLRSTTVDWFKLNRCHPVIFLFILETLFVAFQITGHMQIFGVGWGDLTMLDRLNWSLVASPFLNGLSECWMSADSYLNSRIWSCGAAALVAQTFYIWRIWNFTRNIWVVVFWGWYVDCWLREFFWFLTNLRSIPARAPFLQCCICCRGEGRSICVTCRPSTHAWYR